MLLSLIFPFFFFFVKGICPSQKHCLLQPTVCNAYYTMSPKGIHAGLLASTVLKKLAWQLLGFHLPFQRLMETTSKDFYCCYVESLDMLF